MGSVASLSVFFFCFFFVFFFAFGFLSFRFCYFVHVRDACSVYRVMKVLKNHRFENLMEHMRVDG